MPLRHGARRDCARRSAPLAQRWPRRIAACSGSRIFRRRRSASSTCSWRAGRRSSIPSITSRCSTSGTASSCPTRCAAASGSPACRATNRPAARRLAVPSSRSTARPARGSATCCRTRPTVADDLCIVRSMYTEAINHDPGDHVLPDRLADRRPAQHGRVAQLRAGQREREPAVVRGADHARAKAASRSTRACGAAASCRRGIRACSSAAARPGALSRQSRRASTPDSRRLMLDRLRELHEHQLRRHSPTPRSRPASPSTKWRSACRPACPEVDGFVAEKPETSRPLRPGREEARARSPRTACSRGGWPRRGVRFIQLYHQGWDQHGGLPERHRRCSAARPTRPAPRWCTDLQAARPARRHARRLGRRVRAHELLARASSSRTTTGATTIRAASPSGWPAAA